MINYFCELSITVLILFLLKEIERLMTDETINDKIGYFTLRCMVCGDVDLSKKIK